MNRFLLLFLLIPFFGLSQHSIIGKIVNEQNLPLEYSEITLQTLDSTLKKAELSNENGEFILTEIPKGNYSLEISHFSQTVYSTLLEVNSNLNLKTIVAFKNISLNEIVIQNRRPLIERKVDRIVFNVENSTSTTGGNVFDALKLTPRIKIQNDEISMIGKGNLLVMIDDRLVKFSGEDLAIYLKSLSSDDLKSIEVIANPPAKYSAEGNSGLINIVTKKAKKDAWNGSVKTTYQQATYNKEYFSGTYNLQKGKFQVNSALNYSNGSAAAQEKAGLDYPNLLWREESNRRDFSDGYSGRIGVEYKISEKLSTGATYSFSKRDLTLKEIDKTDLYSVSTNALDSLIFTKARDMRNTKMNSVNYHLIYEIDTISRKLSMDFDSFNFNNNSSREFDSRSYFWNFQAISGDNEKGRSSGIQNVQNYSINLDMEHPTKWVNLNYGGKMYFTETNNNSDYYSIENDAEILDNTVSNEFYYKENTQAAYFSGTKKISEKWESKVGLRYEFTQTTGFSKTQNQINKKEYSKLFPTLYLSYTPNDDHSFNLDYSKRIGRPNYNNLNPFRIVSNQYSYTEGNPFLQPSFSQNLELGYSYKDKLISSLSYYKQTDGFMQVILVNTETPIQQIIPLNILETNSLTFTSTYTFNPIRWWNLSSTINLYYTDSKSNIPGTLEDIYGLDGNVAFLSDLTLNKSKTLTAGLFYSYQTKGISQLDRNSEATLVNLSMKYLMLDKKLVLAISGSDIFGSERYTFTSYSHGIKNAYSYYYDQRYLLVSVLYNFGKSFKLNERTSKNQDELNRAK